MWNQAHLLQVLRLYEQHYNDHRRYCCPGADVLTFGFLAVQRSRPDNALPPGLLVARLSPPRARR
jgi:hypothetical protein